MEAVGLYSDPKSKFESIAAAILIINVNEKCEYDANALLDQLNSLPYHLDKFLVDEHTERLLCHCTTLAPYSEERLVVKFCQVVHNIVSKQSISLKPGGLKVLINYLRPVLEKCNCWTHLYSLTTLTTLVYGNAGKIKEFWDEFFGRSGIITSFVNFNYPNHDVVRIAVKCLEGLTIRSTGDTYLEPDTAHNCYNNLLKLVTAVPVPIGFDEVHYTKIIFRSINAMSNIILHGKIMDRINLGELLAVCKKYMLHGLGKGTHLPNCLHPGPLCTESPSITRSIVDPMKPDKHTTELLETGVSPVHRGRMDEYPLSSETEYSDDEVPRVSEAGKLKQTQGRVRQCALQMLSSVIKVVDRKLMSGYWSSFLPDSSTSTGTLITVILKDPLKRTRVAALSTLSAILETSRHYWALADDRDEQTKPKAFTSLSVMIAHTVHEVLRGLLLALVSDGTFLATTHILKCLATLVSNVPVCKLKTGFLTRVTKATRDYLLHSVSKDTNCEVAAMAVFEAVVSVNTVDNEVLQLITAEDQWRVGGGSSWLVELCIKKVTVGWKDGSRHGRRELDDTPLPLRLEALQVLTAITKNYFQIIRCHLVSTSGLINECLDDEESSVRLHGLRLLEVLGKAIASSVAKQSRIGPEIPMIEAIYIWKNFLCNSLPRIFQDDRHPYLKVKAIDSVAAIGQDIYVLLPYSRQMHCVTLLVGLANEQDKSVQAASVRALGFFVLFPTLRCDEGFMSDVCDILLAVMKDGNADVKVKAAWTLGNFFDALVLNKEGSREDDHERVIGDGDLVQLAREAVLASTKCNERIKSNSVRALGNFLRFIRNELFDDPTAKPVIDETVDVLVKLATSSSGVKVSWNCCYALGNLLRNRSPAILVAKWRPEVLRVLSTLVRDNKNFKVRINAAVALAVPSYRSYFGTGEELAAIWKVLVEAVRTAQEVAGFTEYNHKEQLLEQLCCTICHVITLMTPEDLARLMLKLPDQKDTLKGFISRHACRSGKAGDAILATIQHIATSRNVKPWDGEYQKCIDAISECLVTL